MLLSRVVGRAHERVELHAAGPQRVVGARRGHEPARAPGVAQRADVAAREVDAVDPVEPLPRQVVVAVRHDPLAEHGDRPLALGVEVDEAAALPALARRGEDGHAELLEPLLRAAPELVRGERVKKSAPPASLAACTAATAPPPPTSCHHSVACTISPGTGT